MNGTATLVIPLKEQSAVHTFKGIADIGRGF